MEDLKLLFSQLLLSVSPSKFQTGTSSAATSLAEIGDAQKLGLEILGGRSNKLIQSGIYEEVLFGEEARSYLESYPSNDLVLTLNGYLEYVFQAFEARLGGGDRARIQLQMLGIALLQTFLQANYTGPSIEKSLHQLLFPGADENGLQKDAVSLLSIDGQQAYELMVEPLLLVISNLVFEKLMNVEATHSTISYKRDFLVEEIVASTETCKKSLAENPVNSSLMWWRSRALQVHLSVLPEPSSTISTLSSLLLDPSLVKLLAPSQDSGSEILRHLLVVYYLEVARNGIHSHTEHNSVKHLQKALDVSQLKLILTGAKAKRTKFQTIANSALLILAKSQTSTLYDTGDVEFAPETFNLDSDLLLERAEYESLQSFEDVKKQDQKRFKSDISDSDIEKESLLPIAMKQEDIPAELKELDPNNQPALNDLDNLQLLLRLTVLKQTSPFNSPMVEEELLSLASRVLYTPSSQVNWTIFSRALLERSLLETNKARTIERAILQMTSIVEEMGIKIKSRIIPETPQESNSDIVEASSIRLRFIHQLPLLPQWSLDIKLAEKYMSLGVLKSAVEIYERLQLPCEAALCYAAVDNEAEAERIILNRVQSHPQDARAWSILGDIRQDPSLWAKAWEIGKYSKAKASLSRYYYSPPANSGLTKNIDLAIKHMYNCLRISPLNFENWFFYGCCGLESEQYELASEAFTRCVALDDFNSFAWANLATSLLKLDKLKPALSALKKAIRSTGEVTKSWKIYENFITVAAKLNEWNDVLLGTRELLKIKRSSHGENAIDIQIIEQLVEILVTTEYNEEDSVRLSHFQNSCIDLVCNILPSIITSSARAWRVVARVELWRHRPWSALDCHEKAYRALSQRPELETDEKAWNDAIDACSDLVAAYESLGELPGRHGAGELVCKDWKYKARTAIRSLMSKGKATWEDSEGWNRLIEMRDELSSS